MGQFLAFALAKCARFATRLRGGGSAFPGLVLLRMRPDILGATLSNLAHGVIFVSGSNGKSTTTTMLASVLRAHGMRVFTNPAGGNLPQGLASALVAQASLRGRLRADIAVLEVDEAYGAQIAALVKPDWVALTNVQVDQLNRFGEPENVYRMLHDLSAGASHGVVLNAGDPNLAMMGAKLSQSGQLVHTIDVSDQARLSASHGLVPAALFFDQEEDPGANINHSAPRALLRTMEGVAATIEVSGTSLTLELPAPGLHYGVDATLALAMADVMVDDGLQADRVATAMAGGAPVFGRGEVITYRGRQIALTMMKNLPSLQVNLDALEGPLERVWIAVDEGTPDPSWIYDADISVLDHVDVLSGSKALQWALFLETRGIPYGDIVEDTVEGLRHVVGLAANTAQPVHAIVNYEQMMSIRRLAGYKELEGAS